MGELYSRHVIDLTAVAFHLTHMRELRKLLSAMLREAVQCHKVWSIIMTTLEHLTRSPVNSPQKGQWRGALMFPFDLRLIRRLSKHSQGWWFETLLCPLWRHCNVIISRNAVQIYGRKMADVA